MLDFASARYLGLRHPAADLPPWSDFTTGVPAAVWPPPAAAAVAARLAQLQGCEASIVGASTLHIFWDLLGTMASEPIAILLDDGAYPIARWGVERAAARGVPVRSFRHHDVASLTSTLGWAAGSRRRPLVVCDGFCPRCGKPAPLREYVALARARGGGVLLDDTQALGVLGTGATPRRPFGRGGGGSLRLQGISGPGVLVVASLAKGFGVPIAALSGERRLVRAFEERSETRVHCSPPATPALHAALRALETNEREGEGRRARLLAGVRRFRADLHAEGWFPDGGAFPVQTISCLEIGPATAAQRALVAAGVRPVLLAGRRPGRAALTFVLRADHAPEEVARGARALASVLRSLRSKGGPRVRIA